MAGADRTVWPDRPMKEPEGLSPLGKLLRPASTEEYQRGTARGCTLQEAVVINTAPILTESTQFTIGATVEPIQRAVTHLVVEQHHHSLGRLVPLTLIASATPEQIDLACTQAECDDLDPSRDADYFPMDDYYGGYARGLGYGWGGACFWPHYAYGGLGYGGGWGPQASNYQGTYEAVPSGEVAIRRGDPVRATDGDS